MITRPIDSSLWKNIVNLCPKLNECSYWYWGDGKIVDTWSNVWIEPGFTIVDLNYQMPSSLQHATVADLVGSNWDWNWQLLQSWIPEDVLMKIASILPPYDTVGPDVRFYSAATVGTFSVAKMYQMLCNFHISEDSANWKKIWKLKVSKRVRHFIWMLRYDRLLTNYNKSRMGLGSSMCEYCGNVVEDTLHALRYFPLVMPLWLNIVQLRFRGNFFMGNLKNWIDFNMSEEVGLNTHASWKEYWATACHCLWVWRNKELHDDNFQRPSFSSQYVLNLLSDYKLADTVNKVVVIPHREMTLIGWKPMPVGWVKLNSDGSCRDNGIAGCGGVIRGSDGEWLGCFAKRIGKCSAYMAELWGVYEGLRYARNLGFRVVEVNVDYLLVTNILNSNKNENFMDRALIAKIRLLLAMDWEVVVRHSYREANRCAYALANFGCSLSSDICYYESCPTQFSHLLVNDAMRMNVPRLISV